MFDKIIQTALDNSAIRRALFHFGTSGPILPASGRLYGLNISNLMYTDPNTWPKEFAGRTGFKFFRPPRPNDKKRRGFTLPPKDPEFTERLVFSGF